MNKLIDDLLLDEELGNTRFLTKDEEIILFTLLNENNSYREDIQTIMLKANQKLVYSIAKKYHPIVTLNEDDLVQLGLIGLSNAVDRFDVSKNNKFSTYATYWIIQSISRGLQNALNNINITLKMTELKKLYRETEDNLVSSLKRTPSYDEIIRAMGIDETDANLIIFGKQFESLDQSISKDKDKTLADKIQDDVASAEEELLKHEKTIITMEALDKLNEKEQFVIKYRYGFVDGIYHSYSEIAEKMEISKQRVQIIASQAMNKMKNYVNRYGK